ncbi:hypothetical protein [Vibrio hangzhouensis]|nr:hypothetical protein [Vibrio hangzhouensis]MBY6199267.1 hypothetical protein [Vibrio hangzhouensis]
MCRGERDGKFDTASRQWRPGQEEGSRVLSDDGEKDQPDFGWPLVG